MHDASAAQGQQPASAVPAVFAVAAAHVPVRDGHDDPGARKENAIKINWGSFYTVVGNLEKYGYIEAVEVAREGRRPERTTYQITDTGRAELMDWMRELIVSRPRRTPASRRPSAKAGVVPPDELVGLLQQRLQALERGNDQLEAEIQTMLRCRYRRFS